MTLRFTHDPRVLSGAGIARFKGAFRSPEK